MDYVFYLLMQYKYFILLPLAVIEGPIIAVIAGLLCSRGVMNVLYIYPIIIFGDLIGDSLVYFLGRSGRSTSKLLLTIKKWIGLTETKMERARTFFETNPRKTIALSKVILGVGVAGIYMAGNARVPYSKFIPICLATSAAQYIFYIGLGFLFGQAYEQINHYLNFFASITITIGIAFLLFLLIRSKLKKL